jgi:membrane fusion protein (multidrug efflux system)
LTGAATHLRFTVQSELFFLTLILNTVKQFNIVMKYLHTAVIFFASAVILYGCASKASPLPATLPSAEVIEIAAGSETTYQDYPASIEGAANVEIRPQVDGFLQRVLVDEGAYVQAGQLLFKINDQPFIEQVNSAKSSLNAANAAILNAQLEIDKYTPLVQNKVISEYQLKSAQAAYKIAQANAAQAQAALASAKINLGYTNITAPVSGFIGRLPKKQGSLVSRLDPMALTQLSDVHDVHVYFSLGENDFINFKSQYEGKSLADKLRQLPAVSLVLSDNSLYPIQGKIDMVDGQFDKTTGAITVRANFANKDGLLRSGNTGKIRLGLNHTNTLIVPQAATIEIQDKVYVFAVGDSNKVSRQPITIIGKTGNSYLIKDGLKPGDKIVFSGLDHLQEGMSIKPEKVTNTSVLAEK